MPDKPNENESRLNPIPLYAINRFELPDFLTQMFARVSADLTKVIKDRRKSGRKDKARKDFLLSAAEMNREHSNERK